jgi:transcriptional regulator with GAF, ATPase, and Fis domain
LYPINLVLQVPTTNRDLQQDIADQEFREDLFYRLNVLPIDLPSLAAAAY